MLLTVQVPHQCLLTVCFRGALICSCGAYVQSCSRPHFPYRRAVLKPKHVNPFKRSPTAAAFLVILEALESAPEVETAQLQQVWKLFSLLRDRDRLEYKAVAQPFLKVLGTKGEVDFVLKLIPIWESDHPELVEGAEWCADKLFAYVRCLLLDESREFLESVKSKFSLRSAEAVPLRQAAIATLIRTNSPDCMQESFAIVKSSFDLDDQERFNIMKRWVSELRFYRFNAVSAKFLADQLKDPSILSSIEKLLLEIPDEMESLKAIGQWSVVLGPLIKYSRDASPLRKFNDGLLSQLKQKGNHYDSYIYCALIHMAFEIGENGYGKFSLLFSLIRFSYPPTSAELTSPGC